MADEDFEQVEPGSFQPWPCSPDVARDRAFRGLRIAAPTRIVCPPGARRVRAIVCGAYRLPVGHAGLGWSIADGIWFVATDLGRDRVRVGPAVTELSEPPDPAEEPTSTPPREGPGVRRSATEPLVLEYFNTDLGEALDLPPEPACWFVYAVLGDVVSNVVTLEVLDVMDRP